MTPTKKILFVKRSFKQKGGLEKQAKLILNAFEKQGHTIHLFTEEADDPKSLSTILCNKTSGPSFYKIHNFNQKLKEFLKKNSFDAVFGFDRTEKQTIVRLGNGIHKSYLERKIFFSPWYKTLMPKNPQDLITLSIEKKSLTDPELKTVIANSNMVKTELLNNYSIDPKKIHVIHNGVEWEEKSEAFKDQFNLDFSKLSIPIQKNKIQILFIGHGFKRKGLLFLLKALKNINIKDFTLHVVGDDKNLCYFQDLVKSWKLDSSVCFHGKVSDPKIFFQISDLCIVPSIYDPFANVTVEALNYGIPVISSKYNGGHEIITSMLGSIINDLEDDIEFANVIKKYLQKKESITATKIREEVKYLDISNQLEKILKACL